MQINAHTHTHTHTHINVPCEPVGDGVGRLLYGEKLLPGVCGVNGPCGDGVSGLYPGVARLGV